MAYTIVKSDGTVLTTIADGTINTTSTSLGLPGRNFAGYGQVLDTNFVHQLENFADVTPPPNPVRGQLWYNTNDQTMRVCPQDGTTNAAEWIILTATSSGGTTTFANVTVQGTLQVNDIQANNSISASQGSFTNLTVTGIADINTLNANTANINTLLTTSISTGSANTSGSLTGTWTITGGSGGNTLIVNGGTIYSQQGIRTDTYLYANGAPVNFEGTYGNSNVAAYMPTYLPTYTNQIGTGAATFRGTTLTTGANTTAGTITGNWTLSTGSRLNATYADLAERFAADEIYEAGTVVELGGEQEITAVKTDLSDNVFGVISATAGYLMNAGAGDDTTHPPVAISGRVQVKVIGKINKGDRLVSAGNGLARAAILNEITAFNTIGRSLQEKQDCGIGLVEAIVLMR
jgi:hypothetical protein